MVHHKKFEVRNLSAKYGVKNMGMVALEPIQKGELIYTCDPIACTYNGTQTFTQDELMSLIKNHPESSDYIHMYGYMLDDDLYGVPRLYTTQGVTCECPYVNHACEPNCHYGTDQEQFSIIAFRDIKPGEELTVHYGCHDTEASLWSGIVCKCGGPKCVGVLKFNFWRDKEFQRKYAHCLSAYINRKIKDLHTSNDNSNSAVNVSGNNN